eukprot:m.476632 g.476632  ORF g.476632 m.476632 type:complete len:176 (+) comp20599_c0_seq1:687-1214(+)
MAYVVQEAMRKSCFAIVLSILATLGWLVFIGGFGKHEHDEDGFKFQLKTSAFVYWALALAGLPGIIFTLAYGCSTGCHKCLGVLMVFLNICMFVFAGGVLQDTGTRIANCIDQHNSTFRACVVFNPEKKLAPTHLSVQPYEQCEFAGALLYCLFQSIALTIHFAKGQGTDYASLA